MSNAQEQHIELYKKYRPSRWGNLIGQGKVAQSLRTAVKSNRVPTAYVFSGPRGTGKTSSALLLAKAINCEALTAEGDPCNQCDTCRNIDAGKQLGVNYISMANNGSADDVRELVKNARLQQPVKRQVWILDEVHNIHPKAWDALLIPLEDKSMPSLFIFCTTDVNKIPKTVLSRVQQRAFNLVDADTMTKFVTRMAKVENLSLSEEDLQSAVREGHGSVRDTLTALETIMESGAVPAGFDSRLLEALSERDVTKVLTVLAEANSESVDFRDLTEQLFEDLRDLLLISARVDRKLVGIPPVLDEVQVIKGMLGGRGIMTIMDAVGTALTQMSLGADSRILLEFAMMKAVSNLMKLERASQTR